MFGCQNFQIFMVKQVIYSIYQRNIIIVTTLCFFLHFHLHWWLWFFFNLCCFCRFLLCSLSLLPLFLFPLLSFLLFSFLSFFFFPFLSFFFFIHVNVFFLAWTFFVFRAGLISVFTRTWGAVLIMSVSVLLSFLVFITMLILISMFVFITMFRRGMLARAARTRFVFVRRAFMFVRRAVMFIFTWRRASLFMLGAGMAIFMSVPIFVMGAWLVLVWARAWGMMLRAWWTVLGWTVLIRTMLIRTGTVLIFTRTGMVLVRAGAMFGWWMVAFVLMLGAFRSLWVASASLFWVSVHLPILIYVIQHLSFFQIWLRKKLNNKTTLYTVCWNTGQRTRKSYHKEKTLFFWKPYQSFLFRA